MINAMLCKRFLFNPKQVFKIICKSEDTKIYNFRRSYSKLEFDKFTVFNVKKTLKATGQTFEDGFTCIKTTCPVCDCDNQVNKLTKNIYINKTTGHFLCCNCQHVGNWNNIENLFGSANNSKIKIELEKYQKLIAESKCKVSVHSIPENAKPLTEDVEQILENIGIQNISSSSLKKLSIFCDYTNNCLYFPLTDTLDNIVGYKQIKKEDNSITESTFPDVKSVGLLIKKKPTSKLNQKESTAIVVLSVLDFIALNSQNLNATIICLPHGSKSLPLECLPVLEKFDKLILWFNYDSSGWDTARTFSRKLNEKRCFFIIPTEAQPTPYNALQKNIDLKQILTKAQPILHKDITTFSSLREDVLSDLQNIDKSQGVKWKRFPILNKFLKGHRKGELTILTGSTGCGKTTFMSEYSLDLALQGVNTLWGSFEIRNTRLASTLLRQLAEKPLDENITEFDYWADKFEKLPLYFMTFHGQQTIKVVMEAIEHAQYVHDINHVIIDNLQFMMGTSDDPRHMDRYWKQDAIISSFRTFTTHKNCHVTLVIHPRKERDSEDLTTSSIFGSAKASQEADNVLIIQDKRLTAVRGKKFLQIAKNRYSGDLGIMPMNFDKAGLSYATKKTKLEDTKVES